MAPSTGLKPVLRRSHCYFGSSEDPQALLANAACVCVFLGDVADQLHEDNPSGGLSAEGATGLSFVLDSVATTINTALESM